MYTHVVHTQYIHTMQQGHLLAPVGGCSIDFSRMNAMMRLSKEDHDVTVQPGLGEKTENRGGGHIGYPNFGGLAVGGGGEGGGGSEALVAGGCGGHRASRARGVDVEGVC